MRVTPIPPSDAGRSPPASPSSRRALPSRLTSYPSHSSTQPPAQIVARTHLDEIPLDERTRYERPREPHDSPGHEHDPVDLANSHAGISLPLEDVLNVRLEEDDEGGEED